MRWRRLLGLVLFALAALTVADAPAQQQETRIALIIANEAYGSLPDLPGVHRDLDVMRSALEQARFQVTIRQNLDRPHLRDEIATFARRLAALGNNGVGFLYYAGHGVADGPRGRNYLIPVDANVEATTDLPLNAIALDEALDSIENAHARSTIIVIDACRTVIGRSVGRGFAPVDARTDTIIGFSTGADSIAGDNGLYARTLAAEMMRPGANAETVFGRVQRVVGAATNRLQIPEFRSLLVNEPIVFVPGSAAATPSAAPPSAVSPVSPPSQVTASVARRAGEVFRDCAQCPEMVVIPSGGFIMGSPASEPHHRDNEGPQRRIAFARSFAVGRTEVTRGQFTAFTRATRWNPEANCSTINNDTRTTTDNGTWTNPGYTQDDDHPVVCVSWDDAQAYLVWLNDQVGASALTVSASRRSGPYRLLTESEWEYAARAGVSSAYPWGEDINLGCNYANMADATVVRRWPSWPREYAAVCTDNALRTARVGSYQANRFGLYDMIGNVFEWVQDCHVMALSILPADGSAYLEDSCPHSIRGGYFGNGPDFSRSASRHYYPETHRSDSTGFRVAKTL